MEEVKKVYRELEDVELNLLERIIFNSVLSNSVGRKTIEELKDMGELKVRKNGGINVEVDISEEKRVSVLFGTKWGKYEYRSFCFFTI